MAEPLGDGLEDPNPEKKIFCISREAASISVLG